MNAVSAGDPAADPTLNPVLSPSQLREVAEFGSERTVAAGEVLFEAGEASSDLFVVLEGEAEIVQGTGRDEAVVLVYEPGSFIGEMNLLTGQRRFLTARMTRAGRVLTVGQREFRQLLSVRPTIADVIFGALVARREFLRTGPGAKTIKIIGSRYSPEAMSLRSFAEHSRLAHTWIDLEDAADVDTLLQSMDLGPQDTPVVITPTGILRRATAPALAEQLGLTFQAEARLHLRPGGRRQRPRGPGGGRVRRLRGAGHGVPRRRRRRRSGRLELEDRELRRLPQRHLRW